MKLLTKTFLCSRGAYRLGAVTAFSQEAPNTPKDYLSKEFHAGRREALRKLMPPNSVAVIFAYPERVFSKDVDYVYHPNPDLYYFSGYKEADAALLIFKDTAGNRRHLLQRSAFCAQARCTARAVDRQALRR
jgi:Xaa-Pro aminopeptidase